MLSEHSTSVLGEVTIFFQQLIHDNLHTVFYRNDPDKETKWKFHESSANDRSLHITGRIEREGNWIENPCEGIFYFSYFHQR